MNETHTTVRGTVITDPTTRRVGEDSVFSFRVASNTRYQDRDTGEWKTGGTLYFSANCWGRLAQRASGRLVKGDGVIVQGRLLTNEYEKDGRLQRDLEMRVTALGPDLSRMDVTMRRAQAEGSATASDGEGAGRPLESGDAEDAMEIGSRDADDAPAEESAVSGFAEAVRV
ncbi:single-stranded DNA-binding protein [Dietzia psychralcaliphila]|uniref:Single-stranded DNA-binding protein n=1 Tax=Dietzia psychralcaliphila TaxID=139021 RepID=A0AAD0JP33_9ACTN|nr:single-stranded DNA-binding protein [Dietzia psychralcaliphila]AWH94998.1 single-stranded DNA-binding protein [Dietzia psychralcaliphila]PTM87195.1 single-strand DNA-binding protein [Dietzia psychralcaliphila]